MQTETVGERLQDNRTSWSEVNSERLKIDLISPLNISAYEEL